MKILIVDDESDICKLIQFMCEDIFPPGIEFVLAYSGNKAIGILDESPDFDICICDHNMSDGTGADLLKHLIKIKSHIKFILCSTVTPLDKPIEYPLKHVYFNIEKPEIGKGIEALFQLLAKDLQNDLKTDENIYVPISLEMLVLLEKAPSDIYIKMSENKYIKCINSLEKFEDIDKNRFLKKIIDNLYTKKGEHSSNTNKIIFEMVSENMAKKNLPLHEKISFSHAKLVGLIKFSGISEDLAAETKKNILETVNIIVSTDLISNYWTKINVRGGYPSNLYSLHATLASVVVKKLNWGSHSAMFKLTIAAFLQDISLDSIALMELCDYKEFLLEIKRFTTEEVKRYNDHPKNSVEILAAFKAIPPDVDRILIEQHEMPDGNGFPRKLNANQIGQLSCVFILTSILAKHILKQKAFFDIEAFVTKIEAQGYGQGNFKDAFAVLKTMKNS